ncbi:MAG TPA: hypothetical protein PL033_08860 [Candidatus Brocadiia bacterium]|nr:hypothetical protein [Candidatus Brocadiia bacterium]
MPPIIVVEGDTIPEVWERSIIELSARGEPYQGKDKDNLGKAGRVAQMVMRINKPNKEPRVHKCFPAEPREVLEYAEDLIMGLDQRGWDYTYHGQIFDKHGNQMLRAVAILSQKPTTNKAHIVVGNPLIVDVEKGLHGPCLQTITLHLRERDGLQLDFDTTWRVRNSINAAFMNLFALSELQNHACKLMSDAIGKPVSAGPMTDYTVHYNYNSSDVPWVQSLLNQVKRTDRFWSTEELKEIVKLMQDE